MATKRRFSAELERSRLVRMYLDLREVLAATLSSMKKQPDDLSAAKVDVAVRALKALPGLLLELEKLQADSAKKAKLQKDVEDTLSNLPAPTSVDTAETTKVFEQKMPKLKLPFPLRGA